MHEYGFKVYAYFAIESLGYDIMFVDDRPDGRYVAKPMRLEWEKHEPGSRVVEPSLHFPDRTASVIMKALAEALSEQGLKPDADAKMVGQLQAQHSHLQDLRMLLKLRPSDKEEWAK